MIQFKSDRISKEWHSTTIDPLLKEIVSSAADQAFDVGWMPFLLTCCHRTPEENDALYGGHGDHLEGVHVRWRGVDVSIHDVDPHAMRAVVDSINAEWQYDLERPHLLVALLEGSYPTVPHLHLQTCPSTTKRFV